MGSHPFAVTYISNISLFPSKYLLDIQAASKIRFTHYMYGHDKNTKSRNTVQDLNKHIKFTDMIMFF